MPQSKDVMLWKRAWRRPNGNVYSTRPYASREELLKHEPEDSCKHGNRWCGEPFPFVADDKTLAEYMKYGTEPECTHAERSDQA